MNTDTHASPELRAAISAARAAGDLARESFGKPHEIHVKGPIDFATEIDRDAEEAILRILEKQTPGCSYLSEERAPRSGSADRWIVDPLDGTVNYSRGYPTFCVSIALERAGALQLGVVYDPVLDELFSAERGKGAALNSRPIHVSEIHTLGSALVSTGFPYDAWTSEQDNSGPVRFFVKHTLGLRSSGSAALSLAYIACGRLDGYWEYGLQPYDYAAGMILVREAGGRATDLKGNDDAVEGGEVVAANPRLHTEMLQGLGDCA